MASDGVQVTMKVEHLIQELNGRLPEGQECARKSGIYWKMVDGKPKKTNIGWWSLDPPLPEGKEWDDLTAEEKWPYHGGTKGGWSAEEIYKRNHAPHTHTWTRTRTPVKKELEQPVTWDESVWTRSPGGMSVPITDCGPDGKTDRGRSVPLPAAQRIWHVSPWVVPNLCVLDWDGGNDMNQVPEAWRKLPYTRSASGKFHFYCLLDTHPPIGQANKSNQRQFLMNHPDYPLISKCDLFINGKHACYELADREVVNYDGTLPTVPFDEILTPYINPDKFYIARPSKTPQTP
eukprot:SAG11_NODE_5572_length_1520_cov_23.610134_1_plen_289_part_10